MFRIHDPQSGPEYDLYHWMSVLGGLFAFVRTVQICFLYVISSTDCRLEIITFTRAEGTYSCTFFEVERPHVTRNHLCQSNFKTL